MSDKLNLRWEQESGKAAKAESTADVRALFVQADKDRREYATAISVMAELYSEGKGSELLAAIKAIENISSRALMVAEIAVRSAFGQSLETQPSPTGTPGREDANPNE